MKDWDFLGEENQRLHDRERFLCKPTDKKDRCPLPAKDKAPIHERRAMGRGKGNNESIIDNYIVRLSTLVPSLTESDLQICCFIKSGNSQSGNS